MSRAKPAAPKLPVPLSRFREIEDAEFPVEGLTTEREPKPFQRVGATAVVLVPRMILADWMGMGKTATALLGLKKLKDMGLVKLALVVCPGQVIRQWAKEAEIWFPGGFKTLIIEGDKAKRLKLYSQVIKNQGHPLAGVDLILLTYPILRIDLEQILTLPIDWVGFDEASAIKNLEAAQTRAAITLSNQTSRVLAITATPVQSRLEEYYSIFTAVDPTVLGSIVKFESTFCIIKRWLLDKEHYKVEIKNITGYKNLPLFKHLIQNHVLQREIEDVGAQLPELIIHDRWLNLTKEQRARYEDIEAGIFLPDINLGEAIQRVIRLNQVCDANQLVWPQTKEPSCKLIELENLLRNELRGQQVVIFSRSVEMLQEVIGLVIKPLKLTYGTVIGGQTSANTEEMRQEFEDGKRQVMLISTAGEQGLNLGAGRYLICVDLLYNEGRMQQIYARIRRLSSTHPQAIIIRLLCRDTIEERIIQLLEKRSALIEYLDSTDEMSKLAMKDLMKIVNRRVSLLD